MKVISHSTLVVTKEGKPHDVPPGTPVDLNDEEAKDLIKRGIVTAVITDEAKPTDKETLPKDKAGGGVPKAGNPQ